MQQQKNFHFPPVTAAILTEGDLFLSGGTTLKGFGKAAGIPAGTWASGGNINQARSHKLVLDQMNSNTATIGSLWWKVVLVQITD